jgi:hypothetical protein
MCIVFKMTSVTSYNGDRKVGKGLHMNTEKTDGELTLLRILQHGHCNEKTSSFVFCSRCYILTAGIPNLFHTWSHIHFFLSIRGTQCYK